MANGYHAKTLPKDLNAPAFVDVWRTRALIVGVVSSVIAIILGFLSGDGWNHFLRGWLHGYMMCFNFCLGGMLLLMLQYLTGGKWGLIIRRPLEAMSRTLPLVFLMFLPVGIFGASFGKLYIWAKYSDWATALKNGLISNEQAHAIHYKHGILNVTSFWVYSLVVYAILALYVTLLNKWSLKRDADREPNVPYWRTKFENLSGFGILLYALLLFGAVIYWVMSLDPDVVLDRVRLPVPGGAGIRCFCPCPADAYGPVKGGADQEHVSLDRAARHGQTLLCLCDAEYVSGLRSIPDHMVGQFAGRDSLVP